MRSNTATKVQGRVLSVLKDDFHQFVEWATDWHALDSERWKQLIDVLGDIMTKIQDLQDTVDNLQARIDAAVAAVPELKDAIAKLLADLAEIPQGIDVDTSRLETAVAALEAFAGDPDADGAPGVGDTPPPDSGLAAG